YQIHHFDADAQPGEAVESRRVQVTPDRAKTGDTFTLTLRGKTVSFKATVDGAAHVTARLVAAWRAAADPAFAAINAGADRAGRCLPRPAARPEARFPVRAPARGGDATRRPELVVTQDLDTWQRDAGLRVIQEVELLPADDLPLRPADTSNPMSW